MEPDEKALTNTCFEENQIVRRRRRVRSRRRDIRGWRFDGERGEEEKDKERVDGRGKSTKIWVRMARGASCIIALYGSLTFSYNYNKPLYTTSVNDRSPRVIIMYTKWSELWGVLSENVSWGRKIIESVLQSSNFFRIIRASWLVNDVKERERGLNSGIFSFPYRFGWMD